MIKQYYYLTKPGIIYGNLLSALAGFLLASQWRINFGLLLATLLGTGLVIAAGCVFNNYLDREIDKQMRRTRQRALVTGAISTQQALRFGAVLAVTGLTILALFTNTTVVLIGLIGLVDYVVAYGFFKRRSPIGTLVGSISGATPIIAGYCAANGRFDLGAFFLFLIMVSWQMPHFYAIAIFRRRDYKAAGLPVLPVKKNVRLTKIYMLFYVAMFIVSTGLLMLFGYTGIIYLLVVTTFGSMWLWRAMQGFETDNDTGWAREMFSFSLLVLMATSVMIALGGILP